MFDPSQFQYFQSSAITCVGQNTHDILPMEGYLNLQASRKIRLVPNPEPIITGEQPPDKWILGTTRQGRYPGSPAWIIVCLAGMRRKRRERLTVSNGSRRNFWQFNPFPQALSIHEIMFQLTVKGTRSRTIRYPRVRIGSFRRPLPFNDCDIRT